MQAQTGQIGAQDIEPRLQKAGQAQDDDGEVRNQQQMKQHLPQVGAKAGEEQQRVQQQKRVARRLHTPQIEAVRVVQHVIPAVQAGRAEPAGQQQPPGGTEIAPEGDGAERLIRHGLQQRGGDRHDGVVHRPRFPLSPRFSFLEYTIFRGRTQVPPLAFAGETWYTEPGKGEEASLATENLLF